MSLQVVNYSSLLSPLQGGPVQRVKIPQHTTRGSNKQRGPNTGLTGAGRAPINPPYDRLRPMFPFTETLMSTYVTESSS